MGSLISDDVIRKCWSRVEDKLLTGRWQKYKDSPDLYVWSGASHLFLSTDGSGEVTHDLDKKSMKVYLPDHITQHVRRILSNV